MTPYFASARALPRRLALLALFGVTMSASGCVVHGTLCGDNPDHPSCRDGGGNWDGAGDFPDGGGTDAGPCGQCPSKGAPYCKESTRHCVECLRNTHCSGETPVCDTVENECVECVEHADCNSAAASVCDVDRGECVACDSGDDCRHLDGDYRYCVDDNCVVCRPGSEETDCDGTSCDPKTHECSSFRLGEQETCEPCVSDSDCVGEHNCVPMEHDETPRELGYCLRVRTDGCERPFRITIRRQSRSGKEAMDYCGIDESLVSCEAVRALAVDATTCPSGTDDACPGPGALCRDLGGATDECTYECGGPIQCPSVEPIDTCSSGATDGPKFCGG